MMKQIIPASSASPLKNDLYWGKTALLVIDVQNDYFPGGAKEVFKSEAAASKAENLLTFFRKRGLTVIHIQHISIPGYTYFLPNSLGAEIHPSVEPLPNEPVIIKHKPSSFFETTLLSELKRRMIDHLLLCGMRTNVCIQATALEALKYGYKVTIAEDAVAALDISEHEAGLKIITENNIPLIKTDQLIKSFN